MPATAEIYAKPGKLLIGGEWVASSSGRTLPIIDPAFGCEIGQIAAATADDVDQAVAAAKLRADDEAWSRMAPGNRELLINNLADAVERNADLLAELESLEVGMPIGVAKFLVALSVQSLRYMAGWPSKIEGRTIPVGYPMGGEHFACTYREPIGVVGAIIPWNVPLMIAIWKLAPILATGCTLVLKPSEEASQTSLLLGQLVKEAGIPDGVLNIVTGSGVEAGEALVRHSDVSKIAFTGSTATGRTVARLAAETTKKTSLELGGKSAQIVLGTANLDAAIPAIAGSIFLNSGQTCVAGSRLYVQRKVYDQVVERLSNLAASMPLGHPMEPTTQLGPVISSRQQRRIEEYVNGAREQGALIHAASGAVPEGDGFFVAPTVVEARQDMTIVREEVFGPVISAIPFDDVDEAVALANDSPYGLSAYLYSQDISDVLAIAPRIKAGRVLVNGTPPPYPSIPEGGCKASGYGRDQGPESLDGYLETKVMLVTVK
jgi:phenylacetaldehyde dehydrogenase